MIEILFAAVASFGVVASLLSVASANTRRPVRVRQVPVPAIAVLYSIVAVIILIRFNGFVQDVLRQINEWVPFLGNIDSPSRLLVWENILVLTVFLIIKIVVKPIFSRVFTGSREFGKGLVSRVYEYDAQFGVWFVSRRFGNLRDFWRTYYWVSVAIVFVFFTLAIRFSDWAGFSSISFPVIAALVVGEFYFAIDGLTREEHIKNIGGEKDSARSIANYGTLREVLRRTFPSRVLSDGAMPSSGDALNSGFRIGELSRSSNEMDRIVGGYFERLRDTGLILDVNLVDSSLNLIQGSSQVISNPFYRDLTPYLALPVYYNLLHSKKCLIVAGRDSISTDLVDWMSQGLEKVTGVPDLWQTEILVSAGHAGIDVGVLRYGDIHNRELLQQNTEFLKQVEFVILAEPSRMLATGQVGLSLVFSLCGKVEPKTFAVFDGNHDGLVDSLSHLLKVSLSEVVAAAMPHGASSEMVWKPEGDHMSNAILPGVSRYLGVGTEIAAVAWRHQVKEVNWIGAEVFPVVDMKWIAEQYYGTINRFAGLELSQSALEQSLTVTANPWGLPQAENYFLVVEDEMSNIFETTRRYATRAQSVGFINLISEQYLLRDYMIENRALFAIDAKAIPSLVPDFARTERNLVLRLIMQMVVKDLTLEEISREFELADWTLPVSSSETDPGVFESEPEVLRKLRSAISAHTGVNDPEFIKSISVDEESADRRKVTRYGLYSGTNMDPIAKILRPAYFFVEDEAKNVNVIGSLLFDHVFQSLLPGQFITYDGKFYEVQGISPDPAREGVVLRRSAEHIRDRRGYLQARKYHISEVLTTDSLGTAFNMGSLEIVRSVATIRVETKGYFEYSDRSSLADARHVVISGVPERNYQRKSLLELRFKGIPPSVRKTITLLLNELFVTTFPYSHQYVIALTPDLEKDFGVLLTDLVVDDSDDSIFIVEDSMMDLGLVSAVERNWERLFEIITDYLEWNLSPYPTEPEPTRTKPEFVLPEIPESILRVSWWRRLIRRLRGSRTAKPAKQVHETPEVKPSPPVESEPVEMLVAFSDSHLESDSSDISPDSEVSELAEETFEATAQEEVDRSQASAKPESEETVELDDLGDVNEKE